MTEPIVLTPIGVVRGSRSRIYEDRWAPSWRELLDPAVLDQAATDGLSEFLPHRGGLPFPPGDQGPAGRHPPAR